MGRERPEQISSLPVIEGDLRHLKHVELAMHFLKYEGRVVLSTTTVVFNPCSQSLGHQLPKWPQQDSGYDVEIMWNGRRSRRRSLSAQAISLEGRSQTLSITRERLSRSLDLTTSKLDVTLGSLVSTSLLATTSNIATHAGDLQDSQATAGGTLCLFGEQTFVPSVGCV